MAWWKQLGPSQPGSQEKQPPPCPAPKASCRRHEQARGQVSYLLSARLAHQKGLNPTLHLGPNTHTLTHTRVHTGRDTYSTAGCHCNEGDGLSAQHPGRCLWLAEAEADEAS